MKPKIIYISGNEIFDIADIRAAFDEVRDALGLSGDTVLFGVPVDKDAAFATDIPKKIVKPDVVAVAPETTTPEPNEKEPESNAISEQPVVPILSVLAAKTPVESEQDTATTPEEDTVEQIEDVVPETSPAPIVHSVISETEIIIEHTDDSIVEDAPNFGNAENTLEQLLESMTPLREDKVAEQSENDNTEILDTDNIDEPETETDDDIVLEQLATEFAETEDKIVVPESQPQTQGKIGRLKNILPFKKAKRNETSLMGDLFGWAGIAANDEDFSMPGFFANAAAKK